MTWWAWLWLGASIGLCAGVVLASMLAIARDPGPPTNPNGSDDRDQLAERLRAALNAEEGVPPR